MLYSSLVTEMPFPFPDVKENECKSMSSTFLDITPCGPEEVNQRFGGTCFLHFVQPNVRPNRRLAFIGLYDVISQKR
jgi:hypothetical protein